MFLLDTNIISELRKIRPYGSVVAWLDQVGSTYNVLPMDTSTFRLWAKMMHRQSDTVYEDAMVATTAIVHKLTVVTRNVRDFERFHVPIFNPFEN
jgi:toxin FitB